MHLLFILVVSSCYIHSTNTLSLYNLCMKMIWIMKVGGLLSMIACTFIMRDVLIKYNKGERMRLTHLIVFEVRAYIHSKLSLDNFFLTF